MTTKIQLRRDISTNWVAANPILHEAEPGYELDTGKIKYGDGINHWNDLLYSTVLPINPQFSSYTIQESDAGKIITITSGSVTVPNLTMSAGSIVTIYNNSGSSIPINQGADLTLQWSGQMRSMTGNRTLGLYSICTITFISSSIAVISGIGLI